MTNTVDKLKYPIGPFQIPAEMDQAYIETLITALSELPNKLRAEVEGLSEDVLQKTYRPGGWTIAQVVHHLADSHINSFVYCKLALTEDKPTIKSCSEDSWAEQLDAKNTNIASSLQILDGLHERWVSMLRNLSDEEWARSFIHPAVQQEVSLKVNLAIYAWHGEHHLAHIRIAKAN